MDKAIETLKDIRELVNDDSKWLSSTGTSTSTQSEKVAIMRQIISTKCFLIIKELEAY